MALPDSISTVTVSATYLRPDGSAATGYVLFDPSVAARTPGGIVATAVGVNFDEGRIEVALAATDDPQWLAPGFTYRVTERVDGAPSRKYSISLPAGTPVVDLATLAPVAVPGTPSAYLLANQLGAPGGVAQLDEDGIVLPSQLPGGSGESVAWASITGKPTTFAPHTHTHPESDVTGLTAGLADLDDRLEALEAGGGGGGAALTVVRATVVSGDVTPQASVGAWAAVTGGPTLVLPAAVGDYVSFEICSMLRDTATGFLDLAVTAGGSLVRFLSTGGASGAVEGAAAFYNDTSFAAYGGVFEFVVGSGDLAGGNVTVCFATKGNADGVLYASPEYPLRWRAINYGPLS